MADARIEKLAALLVTYSVAVRLGDTVGIAAPESARLLTNEIYKNVLRASHRNTALHRTY
jgi:aminopeptidase